jgi:hypothetical protein
MEKLSVRIIVSFIILSSVHIVVYANEIRVLVNDQTVKFSHSPRMVQGTLLTQIRPVISLMNADGNLNQETQTFKISYKSLEIYVAIDNIHMTVRDISARTEKADKLPISPTNYNGIAFFPIKAIVEALGAKADWETSNTFHIKTPGYVSPQKSLPSTSYLRINNQTEVSATFSYTGSSQKFFVSTDGNSYDIIRLPSWCSAGSKSKDSFILTCNQNTNASTRNSWFTVKSGDKSVTVNITQNGNPSTNYSSNNSIYSTQYSHPNTAPPAVKPKDKKQQDGLNTISLSFYKPKEIGVHAYRNREYLRKGLSAMIELGFGNDNFEIVPFIGGGSLGIDIGEFIFGCGLRKNIFSSRYVDLPASLGVGGRIQFNAFEPKDEAIEYMVKDRGRPEEDIIKEAWLFTIIPAMDLEIFVNDYFSFYTGYMYRLSFRNEKGTNEIPDEYYKMAKAKQRIFGAIPGTLRFGARIHFGD